MHHFYLQDSSIWLVPLQQTSFPLWKSFFTFRDQLLADYGGQSEVISMMQSWDNISEPFLGHAYEFLRFKGTPVSWVKVVWEPWCLPRHSFIFGLALLGRMRTRDRMHFVDTDASCVFCPDHEESHSHLFFAWSWTSFLWSKVKSWLQPCRGIATISSVVWGLNIRGENIVARMKRSPSTLLSTWYGKKGTKEFLKTLAHWLNLFFGDFRFYSTWYCTFMSAIILKFLWADRIGGCSRCSLLWDVVFSSVCSSYSHYFWADRIGCCCFSWSFVVLHDTHVYHSL